MSDIAIEVEGISKRYRIGARESYKTLRETLNSAALAPFRKLRSMALRDGRYTQRSNEEIWALSNVCLEVKRGEVVGLIGRNGAGKSTLLKILSRITEPTEGYANIHGRVGSLLEVGIGFHAELTGRENTYLNGAVLGMRRHEVARKFDEIVDFSGIEQFVDTPVKRYSSGMYLRLAFAVAAHLETEILLVDEVLAVGDASFQKKCLQKMDAVAREGRTVLFVSHNLQAILRLCSRACLMDRGKLITMGTPAEVIGSYTDGSSTPKLTGLEAEDLGPDVQLTEITIMQGGHEALEFMDSDTPFEVRIKYRILNTVRDLLLGFDFFSADGTLIFRTYDMQAYGLGRRPPGVYESTCRLPGSLFRSGYYQMHLIVGIHRRPWLTKDKITIGLHFGGLREYDVTFPGVILPIGEWTVGADEEVPISALGATNQG